jgi:hypothetical protein
MEGGAVGHNFERDIKPILAEMVPGWVPFKIVSDSPTLHSRWPLLLKIEISSNGKKSFTEKPGIYAKLLLAM